MPKAPHITVALARPLAPSSPRQHHNSSLFPVPNDVNNLDMDDELYFDDGGFEGDVNDRSNDGEGMDENAFDDDSFLNRPNGAYHNVRSHKPDVHRREFSNDTVTGLGGDAGPYPSFAVPNAANAAKARARDSQLLLEDLPLQEEVDPKLIPRRNPSEDAKRLGLSGRVPAFTGTAGYDTGGCAEDASQASDVPRCARRCCE